MSQTRSPGRPSQAVERSSQIVDAFIGLVAAHGLEAVTLDDVAWAAEVKRSVIRHYVGNRQDLVWAAVDRLTAHYGRSNREALGDDPSIDRWLDHLFGDSWVRRDDDAAFDVLLQEAIRDTELRRRLHAGYRSLVGALAASLRQEIPDVARGAAVDTAYAIVCLAEHNLTMQALEFPATRAAGARRAAATLVDDLRRSATPRARTRTTGSTPLTTDTGVSHR